MVVRLGQLQGMLDNKIQDYTAGIAKVSEPVSTTHWHISESSEYLHTHFKKDVRKSFSD